MSKKSPELASGGVVWRDNKGKVEVLVAHRPGYDDWTFPKGKIEDGESSLWCALREVKEETGLKVRVGQFLGVSKYQKNAEQPKEVSYWAMKASNSKFKPSSEVDQVQWVSLRKLAKNLSYEVDRQFVDHLGENWTQPPDRLLLVRHANAGIRGGWTGEDSQRPLSGKGRRQAAGIVQRLKSFDIDRIFTSPAARCQQTVEPLAKERGLSPIADVGLWEESDPGSLIKLFRKHPQGVTLICSHRPNLAAVLPKLVDGDRLQFQKGAIWVLDISGGQILACNYFPPLGVGSKET